MPEPLVRSGLVIVAEELTKEALEVTGTEDENVIQKLASHRAHPALGEGIGSGSPEGQPDYLYALALEDLVKGRGELRVPVTK